MRESGKGNNTSIIVYTLAHASKKHYMQHIQCISIPHPVFVNENTFYFFLLVFIK